jgi:hypothetical protein
MFSCDYNGWADVPEEEREALDVYQIDNSDAVVLAYVPFVLTPVLPTIRDSSERRAA